jgi:ABC-type bacteriocin/lantibiotic exporter with double-glycine peptidase domain
MLADEIPVNARYDRAAVLATSTCSSAKLAWEGSASPNGTCDMGSTLSRRQKQRVLLARALYRRPRVLLLDEGTAHLDIEREKQIVEALRHLEITRISVAHRLGMTAGADRIIRVGGIGA